MIALRYINASAAVLLGAVVAALCMPHSGSIPLASAEGVARVEISELPSAPVSVAPTRQVRVIDLSADNAGISDRTSWHNRARKPAVQKNTRADVARSPVEARPLEKRKTKTVRRAVPPLTEAYSAYASQPTPRRGGLNLFAW
jgi:hypothetical protein